jgi:outer membrane protein assembly factor BamB
MTIADVREVSGRKELRLWPGVVAVVLMWFSRIGIKALVPGFAGFAQGMQGALLAALAILLWWMFFSRARWFERVGVIALMAIGLTGAWLLKHDSMGPLWLMCYAVPVLCTVLVAWAVATRRLTGGQRRVSMAAALLLACGIWTLVRTDGINGDHQAQFEWRWAASPEERLLATGSDERREDAGPSTALETTASKGRGEPLDVARARPAAQPSIAIAVDAHKGPAADPVRARTDAELTAKPGTDPVSRKPAFTRAEWPGFRGRERDGVVHGPRIETDWARTPPVEMWRRPIGPGWSSFAVRDGLIYTQEQRGNDEVVACYDAATGRPVWTHRDRARFFESNAGAGPRGTPTLDERRVYTFGATGILNALDAESGAAVWSRNVTSDVGATVPYWGFSSSPVVTADRVIVAAAGQLLAYDRATGDSRWTGPDGEGYSSPHLVTIDGVPQILLLSSTGAISVAPVDGEVLWQHSWKGSPIVQPAVTADGVLIVAGTGSGTRRLLVTQGSEGWRVEERWTSNWLKPYFNDFVIHRGTAFGFDGSILASIDLANGERKWKGGRYGSGQMIVLPDQDVLLVLSEDGNVVLVSATADKFTEIARFKAIEGKTWNHPVLVGGVLLVRNGEEMAAFRLPLARPLTGSR